MQEAPAGASVALADDSSDAATTTPFWRPTLRGTLAFGCGCLASAAWRLDGATALRLVAAWLLADVAIGSLMRCCAEIRRLSAQATRGARPIAPPATRLELPYAMPGSPGARLTEGLSRAWDSAAIAWRPCRRQVVAGLGGALVALVLGAFLGASVWRLTVAAVVASPLLALMTGRDEHRLGWWSAGCHSTVAWTLGHLAWAELDAGSLGLAGLMGLGLYAGARAQQRPSAAASCLLLSTWGVLMCALVMARQPILAAAVAMAALSERVPLPEHVSKQGIPAWVFRVRPAWLVSMLLGALALPYWG